MSAVEKEVTQALAVTVDGAELNKVLKALKPVVTRNVYPVVLTTVLVEISNGQATFTVCNGTSHLSVKMAAEGSNTSFRVYFEELFKAVNRQKGPIDLFIMEDRVRVKAALSNTMLARYGGDDGFPTRQDKDLGTGIMDRASFLAAVQDCKPYMATRDDSIPVCQGIHFGEFDGNLRAVATDNFRLAAVPVEGLMDAPVTVRDAVKIVNAVKVFGGPDIHLNIGTGYLGFRSGPVSGHLAVIDGQYFDYRTLDGDWKQQVFVAKEESVKVCQALKAMVDLKGNVPQAKLQVSDGGFKVDFTGGEDCPPMEFESEEFNPDTALDEIAFNPKILLDGLKMFPEGCAWNQKNRESAVKLTDGEKLALVLPVRYW